MAPRLYEDSEDEAIIEVGAGTGGFPQTTPAEIRRASRATKTTGTTCPPSPDNVAFYKGLEMLSCEMQALNKQMAHLTIMMSALFAHFRLDNSQLQALQDVAPMAGPSHESHDSPQTSNLRPPPLMVRVLNSNPSNEPKEPPNRGNTVHPPAPAAGKNQRAGPPSRSYSEAAAAAPRQNQSPPANAHNNKRNQQPRNAHQARGSKNNYRPQQIKWSQPPYICDQPQQAERHTQQYEQPRLRPQGHTYKRRFPQRGRHPTPNPNTPPWIKSENPSSDTPDATFRRKYVQLLEAAKKESETPNEKGNCRIVEVKGDLIKLMQEGRAKNALHLVACDMPEAGASAGIAAKLLQTFPVPKVPRGFKKEIGAVLTQPMEETGSTLHHVMYKQRSVDKIYWAPEAYLTNMDKGMDGIADLIRSNKMTEMWMPRILSGCDRLHWSVVSRWLQDKLADCPHPITLFVVSWDGETRTVPRPPPAEPNDGWRTVTPRRRGPARPPAASPHNQRGGADRGTQHRIAPVEPIQTRSRAASQRQQPF